MHQSSLTVLLVALCWAIPATPAVAQFHEPDPDAVEAFEKMIETYRERPAFTVDANVAIELEQDGLRAHSGEVTASFTIGQGRRAVLHIRGFTVYVADGEIAAVHEDNDDAYFRSSDGGSAYYSLTNAFVDLPFPHIAIAFGEADALDLCMQFHPRAPWSRPTSAEKITSEAGEPMARILLTSDHEQMELLVDPKTQFIESITLKIIGGHYAREGVNVIYEHEFNYEIHDEDEIEGLFAFDPGDRRRVDTLAALRPRQTATGGERRGVGGGLTGGEAPPITLPTLNGEVFNLEDHRGEVVVLDFWATWCRPCLRVLPPLHEIAAWAEQENLPVTIATVNVWEIPDADESTPEQRREQAAAFWDRHEFTLPVLMDTNDDVATAYRLQGIPATIVIRPDGIVHREHIGIDDYDTAIRQAIQEALAEGER